MRNLIFIGHIWNLHLFIGVFFCKKNVSGDFIRYSGKKIQTSIKKFGLLYNLHHSSIHRICHQN